MFSARFSHLLCCLLIPIFTGVASADPIEEENQPTPSPPAPKPAPEPMPAQPAPVPVDPAPVVPTVDTPTPTEEPPPVEPVEPVSPVEPVPPPAPVEPVVEAAPEAAPEPEPTVEDNALPLKLAVQKEETRLRLGGLKGGLNAGRFVGKVKGEGVNFGLALGAFIRLKVTDRLALQPEFLMTDKGSDVKGLIETEKEALLFLEVPLLMRYDFHRHAQMRFYGLAGPSLAYLIDANTVPEEERSTFDMAMHAGLGFEIGLGNHDVNVELRGGQGIRNLIRDTSGLTARTTVMSLYAGISL
jgi:hypothetical protein